MIHLKRFKKRGAELANMYWVSFPVTNESLDAIVNGLDPREDDRVLAVAGSGDQAFACLENAGSVKAIDYSKPQLQLVNDRAEVLRMEDHESFLSLGTESADAVDRDLLLGLRDDYFLADSYRLRNISKKTDSLEIAYGDIFAEALGSSFSKIYLSNVIGFCGDESGSKLKGAPSFFRSLSETLPSGGAVYIADGRAFFQDQEFYHLGPEKIDETLGLDGDLRYDHERSLSAKQYELCYDPIVLTR